MLKSKKTVWNNRPMLNVCPRSLAAVKGISTTAVAVRHEYIGHVQVSRYHEVQYVWCQRNLYPLQHMNPGLSENDVSHGLLSTLVNILPVKTLIIVLRTHLFHSSLVLATQRPKETGHSWLED